MAVASSPIDLTQYLQGARFPANRDEVVRCARQNGADRELLVELNRIPDRSYRDTSEVMDAFTELQQQEDEFDVDVEDEDVAQRRRA